MTYAADIPHSHYERHKSLNELVKLYGKQLKTFIKSKVSILEDAEDILQDVWTQISKLTHLKELENSRAWLYSVAKNRITDFYRKTGMSHLEDYTYENQDGIFEIREILLADNSTDPELALFREVFWNELNSVLATLPDNQRSVFVENEIEGKTLQTIADENGENIKTIISRKGYAMKVVREKLRDLL